MDNNAIVKTVSQDDQWNTIIQQLVDEVSRSDMPEKVIRATEMMVSGYPTYKIARKLGVSSDTVRRWLTTYPTMASIVANSSKLLAKWRMSKLEQQFLSAVERSQEILDVDLSGVDENGRPVDPKVLTVIAAQARYVIGLFAGQQSNIKVTHELGDTVLKAKEDALAYLAEQLAVQRDNSYNEPIEAVVRVIDNKIDNQGPMLDEDGNPPHGGLGILDMDNNGTECHICGKRVKGLARHLLTKHGTTTEEYETLYILEDGSVRRADGYWDKEDE